VRGRPQALAAWRRAVAGGRPTAHTGPACWAAERPRWHAQRPTASVNFRRRRTESAQIWNRQPLSALVCRILSLVQPWPVAAIRPWPVAGSPRLASGRPIRCGTGGLGNVERIVDALLFPNRMSHFLPAGPVVLPRDRDLVWPPRPVPAPWLPLPPEIRRERDPSPCLKDCDGEIPFAGQSKII
jgi:hypothetical protein